jgi:hypothetical protein
MTKTIDIELLLNTTQKNVEYLTGKLNEKSGVMTKAMVDDIIDKIKSEIPQVRSGFGLGFPYHSMDKDGKIIPNPEFFAK